LKHYQINIRPTAETDIRQRYHQIHEASPANAKSWYLNLVAAIKTLEHLALRCPIADEAADIHLDIRQLVVGRYRVLYFVQANSVEILHIRHVRHDRNL